MKNLKTLAILSLLVVPSIVSAASNVPTLLTVDGGTYKVIEVRDGNAKGGGAVIVVGCAFEPAAPQDFVDTYIKLEKDACVLKTPEERQAFLAEKATKENIETEKEAREEKELEDRIGAAVETRAADSDAEIAALWEQVRLLQELLSLLIAQMSLK